MAQVHLHSDGRGGSFECTQPKCIDAFKAAAKQHAKLGRDFYSLEEYVESLEIGTIFEDTDDLGRKNRMMRVFQGVVIDNGVPARPFHYGDSWENGYSVKVTHTPQPIKERDE